MSEAGHSLSYRCPAGRGEDVFLEKGSRFAGVCVPASSEDEAKRFIASVRELHRDASHNVYAYRLKNGVCRYSDDGEPSGTAGPPAFEVLARRGVVNAVIVVTRYFGGTLLGAGGLVRAYAKSAAAALEAAGIAEMRPWRAGEVAVPYALYEQVARLLAGAGAKGVEPDFGADVTVRFTLPEEDWDAMTEALRELTAGGAEPVGLGGFYA